jgi:hypothetical protein
MAGDARPFEEKAENQSILADMMGHCESLNALANNLSATGIDDNINRGMLVTEIITLEEQIKIVKGHINNFG